MSPATGAPVQVGPVQAADLGPWVAMRSVLWPDADVIDLDSEAHALLDGGEAASAAFVAERDGVLLGFAEATLRHDYVNGTTASPVGFLEAWYVAPAWRGRGVGRRLAAAVEAWTRARGCAELASDAAFDNAASQAAHAACGFEETERVVYFRKQVG